MKLFFAIPFFSNAKYLEETLKSLCAQTNPDWDAVVLDDSIDSTEAKAASGCVENLNDPRVRYLKNPKNLGLAKNWNQGLDLGCDPSKYLGITILHADDKLDPHYVQAMVNGIRAFPEATAFFCKTKIIDDHGNPSFSFPDWYKEKLIPKDDTLILKGLGGIQQLIPGNFIFCPTLCFVPSRLKQERFKEDLKQVPDFEMILRFLLKEETLIGLYQMPLYQYRRHSNNTTQIQTRNLLRFQEERDLYLTLSQNLLHKSGELAAQAKQMRVIKLNLIFNAVTALFRLRLQDTSAFLKFLLQLP